MVVVKFKTFQLPPCMKDGTINQKGPYGGGWVFPNLSAYNVLRLYHDRGTLYVLIESDTPTAILSDKTLFTIALTNRYDFSGSITPKRTVQTDISYFQPVIVTGEEELLMLKQWGLYHEPPETGVTTEGTPK